MVEQNMGLHWNGIETGKSLCVFFGGTLKFENRRYLGTATLHAHLTMLEAKYGKVLMSAILGLNMPQTRQASDPTYLNWFGSNKLKCDFLRAKKRRKRGVFRGLT